ncbi:MAG: SgcJ/EcaC family oxidoreductase [Anaerolineales bacterium]
MADSHQLDDIDAEIRALYHEILNGWNWHNGAAMAASFADEAEVVGFDGSQITGRETIIAEMDRIFRSSPPSAAASGASSFSKAPPPSSTAGQTWLKL